MMEQNSSSREGDDGADNRKRKSNAEDQSAAVQGDDPIPSKRPAVAKTGDLFQAQIGIGSRSPSSQAAQAPTSRTLAVSARCIAYRPRSQTTLQSSLLPRDLLGLLRWPSFIDNVSCKILLRTAKLSSSYLCSNKVIRFTQSARVFGTLRSRVQWVGPCRRTKVSRTK